MRRLFVLITALVLIFSPAAAQSNTDAPRLRIAPPSEVLDTLIELAAQYRISPMKGDDLRLSSAVMAEFRPLLDSPNLDFETRLADRKSVV